MRLKWLVAVALICGIPAFAGPILLNNTGINGGVAIGEGLLDPNWNQFATGPTYVTTGSATPSFPFGLWLANDSTSQWISPQATYIMDVTADGLGGYPFSTTFDLTGFDPSTALITGRWLADNQGYDIYINGVATGQTTGANPFTEWSSFMIDSGFQPGLNTLTFTSLNTGGPVGVRVELSGTADEVVPEPATFVLLGAGLLGLGLLRRARKSA